MMINLSDFLNILTYPFMSRAIVVGILVSLCASLLGVILVLKRYSLIGHGLADVGFASLSLAMAVGSSPLLVSTPIMIITSFVIMYISQSKKINGDVAIGIFSTGALAFGIIVTAFSKGLNIDVYNYMFGSILAISPSDVTLSILLAIIVLTVFVLFYNRLFLITLDEDFAKASGVNITFYQFLISFFTALTVVIGMRLMGTLLISSLIIFPAVIAQKFAKSFKSLIFFAAITSVFCFLVGIFISFIFNLPTGAGIVFINIVAMIVCSVFNGMSARVNLH